MTMDWKTVGKIIVPLAPALGSILGGFAPIPGGSLMGQLAGQAIGNVIAKKLGVPPTPDAVAAALGASNDKDVLIAKLNAAADELRSTNEAYARVESAFIAGAVKNAGDVNETMREEVRPENRHWFFTGWRPACGWIFAAVAAGFGAILLWACGLTVQRSADPLKALSDAWPLFLSYFAVLGAMVGVYVIARTQEKAQGVARGTSPPSKPLKG